MVSTPFYKSKNRYGDLFFFSWVSFPRYLKAAVAECTLQTGIKGCGAVEVKMFLLTKEA